MLPRKERNNLRSKSSRGPKFFRARRMLAAPCACPDNICPVFPMNVRQTKSIITAHSVLEAVAWSGSSRYTRRVLSAYEYFANASVETGWRVQKPAWAVVTASTARSSASLLPSRRGTSSRNMPKDHHILYRKSVDRFMAPTNLFINDVILLPGYVRGISTEYFSSSGDLDLDLGARVT